MFSYLKVILLLLLGLVSGLASAQTSNALYTVLASTAQTAATVNSTDQTNLYYRGGHLIVTVSAYTSGNYTVHVQAKSAVSGLYYDVLVGSAISSTGTTVLKIYPGIAVLANGSAADVLPKTWRVQLIGASTPIMTMSVEAALEN